MQRSNQLSYEATDVKSWSFVGSHVPVRNESTCAMLLQYSSKILKHGGLSASKHAWLNIGEGEGTFQVGKQCEVEISGFV